jgi:hypothetical protein
MEFHKTLVKRYVSFRDYMDFMSIEKMSIEKLGLFPWKPTTTFISAH